MPDTDGDEVLRPLSAAQQPIWRAEVLHRHTPRWTQVTVATLRGAVDPDRLEQAIGKVVARHPALRTRLRLRQRQAWQAFAPPERFELARHRQPTAAPDRAAALDRFLDLRTRERFALYGAPLFRADLLVLAPDACALVLRLHHVAADGIALALVVAEIAARLRGDPVGDAPDPAYERWLDRSEGAEGEAALEAALAFHRRQLAGAPLHHPALYDRPDGDVPLVPPDLAEATVTLDRSTCEALRAAARGDGATLFILLLAAYAALLRDAARSSDLVVSTFVSGRTGAPAGLVGSCINTVAVRVRLDGSDTRPALVAAVREAWRPVRRHVGVPQAVLADADRTAAPLPRFAINYLDMDEAPFAVPGVAAQVTHAQQGFPLNDLLFYALREQDGRLRLRLIVGSGTPRLSQGRVEAMLRDLAGRLRDWADGEGQDSAPNSTPSPPGPRTEP